MSWSTIYDGRAMFDAVVEAIRAMGIEVEVRDSSLTYSFDDYGYDQRPFRRAEYLRPDGQMMIVEEWIAKERSYGSGLTRYFGVASYLFGRRPELVTQVEHAVEV